MTAVVIGGEIMGLCSADYCSKKGWQVTIVDKTDLSEGCSYANPGMIVQSHAAMAIYIIRVKFLTQPKLNTGLKF